MTRLQLATSTTGGARSGAAREARAASSPSPAAGSDGDHLGDVVEVVTARRRVDEVLARLVAQPFDEAAMADLDRWRQECLPSARGAWARLRSGGSGPFQTPEAGEPTPVAGARSPSRVRRPRAAAAGA